MLDVTKMYTSDNSLGGGNNLHSDLHKQQQVGAGRAVHTPPSARTQATRRCEGRGDTGRGGARDSLQQ